VHLARLAPRSTQQEEIFNNKTLNNFPIGNFVGFVLNFNGRSTAAI
jgi:hypothetical protein